MLLYRGELKIVEYRDESIGEDVEEGEDLGDTTLDAGLTAFLGLVLRITPV